MKARLYTSWNNRKARRFHRKDHRNCQAVRRFHSSEGFTKQTQIHNLRITQFSHPSAKTAFFLPQFFKIHASKLQRAVDRRRQRHEIGTTRGAGSRFAQNRLDHIVDHLPQDPRAAVELFLIRPAQRQPNILADALMIDQRRHADK